MHSTATPSSNQASRNGNGKASTCTLGEIVAADFLPLSKAALHEVGEATQTLGAMYRLCRGHGETFHSIERIARIARLNRRTCERHLEKLVDSDWLINRGRERSSNGRRLRRTNTWKLTDKANKQREPFLRLPSNLAHNFNRWSDRAVFAAVVSRHLLIQHFGIADNHGRESYSLVELMRDTGLAKPAVIAAKRRLVALALIHANEVETYERDELGRIRTLPDEIFLNSELAVQPR